MLVGLCCTDQSQLAVTLLSKTIPQTGAKDKLQTRKKAWKRKQSKSPQGPSSGPSATVKKPRPVTVEEVEDEDAPSKNPSTALPPPQQRKVWPVYAQFNLAYVVISASAIQFIISMKRSLLEPMARQLKVPGTSSAVMGIERC